MKQMDEMERSIQLRSEERGYRAAVLALCAWTLFHSWQTLFHGAEYHPLPSLILCFAVSVQSFSQIALKQKWFRAMKHTAVLTSLCGQFSFPLPRLQQWFPRAFISLPRHNSTMRNAIRQLRKQAVLRQEGLTNLLGVSRQTIIAIENDKYTLHA